MTIEESDRYADIILSTPRMYDKYPDFFPSSYNAMVRGYHMPWSIGLFTASLGPGVYNCSPGFMEQYEKQITEWKSTSISYGGSPRYLTLEDLKMMLYVGTEYSRNKLYGYRYRFNERGINTYSRGQDYPHGCIVRDMNGHRWIHRTQTPNAIPPPGYTVGSFNGDSFGFNVWTPFTRRVGMYQIIPQLVPLIADVTFPTEPVTRCVRAATIEGNDDIVFLRDMIFPASGTKGSSNGMNNTFSTLCAKGDIVVRISTYDNLNENTDGLDEISIVFAQGRTRPVYIDYDTNRLYSFEAMRGFRLSNNAKNHSYVGNWVPLKKGVTYHVYIERKESCVFPTYYEDGGFLSILRMSIRGKAPSFKWNGV